jgi:hypothetical protein
MSIGIESETSGAWHESGTELPAAASDDRSRFLVPNRALGLSQGIGAVGAVGAVGADHYDQCDRGVPRETYTRRRMV